MAVRRTTLVLVTAAAVLALGACGDDDTAATTTIPEESTTTAGETTTTAGETSTTAAETTTTAGGELGDEPPFRDDGPSGSGCEPGRDELPDGWWYGSLVVPPDAGPSFDLACYYVGPAAEAVAAERGDEVTNDYYVVNDNPTERTLTIADGATASCVEMDTALEMVDCTPQEVAGDWNVWIRVVGGEVDRLVEQYAP